MGKKTKRITAIFILALLICAMLSTTVFASSKTLAIPWRHQWLNDEGYCGETAIQDAALYYGTYISQNLVRVYAGGEVMVGCVADPPLGSSGTVYDDLKLTYSQWQYDDVDNPTPQYQNFLNWLKRHLEAGHPVNMGVYLSDSSDSDFDHVIPAIGYSATSGTSIYSDDDTITYYNNFYNDDFNTTYGAFTRTFGSFYSTRKNCKPSSPYYEYLPRDWDYGDAVTGVVDPKGETFPVSLSVDVNDEPNVTQGATPVNMNATIKVSDLKSGSSYMLLRYNDYTKIPSKNFLAYSSEADQVQTFTATDTSITLNDRIMSDTMAAYRCVLVSAPTQPIITTNFPDSITVIKGGTATFAISATPAAATVTAGGIMSYSLYKDDNQISNPVYKMENDTMIFSIANVTDADNGTYYCQAKYKAGKRTSYSATSNFCKLTIVPPDSSSGGNHHGSSSNASTSSSNPPIKPANPTTANTAPTDSSIQTGNLNAFSDAQNHWAKDAIGFVAAKGLFGGTGNSIFSPNEAMTRGMLVTVLGRLYSVENGELKNENGTAFNDVNSSAYYAPFVSWASANGIVTGVGGGQFAPDKSITREQLAVMLYHYADRQGITVSNASADNINKFGDSGLISDWSKAAMAWAVDEGLLSGKSTSSLDPKGLATRAEVATIVKRFYEMQEKRN